MLKKVEPLLWSLGRLSNQNDLIHNILYYNKKNQNN